MSNILIYVRDAWRRALPLAVVVLRRARGSGTFRLVTLVVAAVLILSLMAVGVYTAIELSRFQRVEARRTTLVYAAGQRLVPGVNVRTIDLAGTLRRLKYKEVQAPAPTPGQFRREANVWEAGPVLGPKFGPELAVLLQTSRQRRDHAHLPERRRFQRRGCVGSRFVRVRLAIITP